jgi:hypothetical protein
MSMAMLAINAISNSSKWYLVLKTHRLETPPDLTLSTWEFSDSTVVSSLSQYEDVHYQLKQIRH